MLTRTRSEAIEAFLQPLRRALSCVTKTPLVEGRVGGLPSSALLNGGRPVRLRGRHDLRLSVSFLFAAEETTFETRRVWRSVLRGYVYLLLRADGREVLAYHWHTTGLSHITDPHVHVSASAEGIDIRKAHLPTARVDLPQFLRFLIVDLGVDPLRPDWQAILQVPSSAPSP